VALDERAAAIGIRAPRRVGGALVPATLVRRADGRLTNGARWRM
jgi:hypothetical protein